MPAFDFVLAGRYRLVAPLGEGGMAAVYRGRDLRLNREVAVKVMHDTLLHDPDFRARFQREAQLVASLSHPNIVPVYDVGEEGGTDFIVMEYVRGRTLKEMIEREGRLPEGRAILIITRVLDALGHAHANNLIHRDVKPQNVLLMGDGTPRLADFGIARLVDGSSTRTAAILGSAQYLSPEQSRGEDATARSDIYACGIVLYEMLCGSPPFDGPNALAVAHQHLHVEPPPLQNRVPGLDPILVQAVGRALAKDPESRFADTQSFVAALPLESSSEGATAAQPLNPSEVATQRNAAPAPLERPRTTAHPVGRDPNTTIVIRRSTRKTHLLVLALVGIVLVCLYLAQLPLWSNQLPAYPSAPYALLPALCLVIAVLSYINTRSWVYSMDANAAVVQWGLLGHHRFGVPLRQIVSLELKQSVIDRILGVGTVELTGRDQHGAEQRLVMEDLPRPRSTYEDLTQLVGRAAHPQPNLPDDLGQ